MALDGRRKRKLRVYQGPGSQVKLEPPNLAIKLIYEHISLDFLIGGRALRRS